MATTKVRSCFLIKDDGGVAEFELKISVPEWRLTAAEEQQRVKDAETGWAMFSNQLNEALEKQKRGQKDPEAEWNEHDYEKFLKESDARTDKYMELQSSAHAPATATGNTERLGIHAG